MSNNDLISREYLRDAFDNLCCHNCKTCRNFRIEDSFYRCALIDNAPTVETSKIEYKAYNEGFKDGVEQGIRLSYRPQGKWSRYKRSRYKRRCGMSNDKLNDAIKTIKELCEVQKACIECPMNCNCGNCPKDWEEEKNNA